MSAKEAQFAVGSIIRRRIPLAAGILHHHTVVVNDTQAVGYDGKVVRYEDIKDQCLLDCPTGLYMAAYVFRQPISESHAKEIVERATSRLGEHKYHVAFQNCETFADWCYHGDDQIPESAQAKHGASTLGALCSLELGVHTGVVGTLVHAGGVWGLLGYTTTAVAIGPLMVCTAGGALVGCGLFKKLNESSSPTPSDDTSDTAAKLAPSKDTLATAVPLDDVPATSAAADAAANGNVSPNAEVPAQLQQDWTPILC